jgi:hypothetical protein
MTMPKDKKARSRLKDRRLGFEEPIPMKKPTGELGVVGVLSLYNQLAQNLREYRAVATEDREPMDIGYFNLY